MRYREMLDQFLISGEVYADLTAPAEAAAGQHIDRHPPLDIEMGAAELIKRVPLFENLSARFAARDLPAAAAAAERCPTRRC